MENQEVTLQDLATQLGGVATTLDDLAVSVKQGFDAVDKRFDTLERTVSDISIRLDYKANQFDIDDHGTRIVALEKEVFRSGSI